MKRRNFLQLIGAVIATPVLPISAAAAPVVLSEPEFGTIEGVRWIKSTSISCSCGCGTDRGKGDCYTSKQWRRHEKLEPRTTPLSEGDACASRMTTNMNRTLDDLTKKAVLGEL